MPETTPPESPEDLGNTIDGSGAGDGSTARTEADDDTPDRGREHHTPGHTSAAPGDPSDPSNVDDAGDAGPQDPAHHSESLEEQKRIYQTPEQPGHALGGSDGTADGS